MKHLLSIDDLSKDEIEWILQKSKYRVTKQKILGTLFFEPSTRTKLSFHTAMYNLGGQVIDLPENSSQKKGESEEDTVRTISKYADILAIRHSKSGRVRELANYSDVPVINAGDGDNEHPTQALLDLRTINQYRAFVDSKDLTVMLFGDLLYSRTINSLLKVLDKSDYNINYILTAAVKEPPKNYITIKENEIGFYIDKVDVLYMTRFQKERRFNTTDWEFESRFILKNDLVNKMGRDAIILHPFPRNEEIHPEVDNNVRAVYFKQIENGVGVRSAVIEYLL